MIAGSRYPHCDAILPMNATIPKGSVFRCSDRMNSKARVYSFHTKTKVNMPHEISPGMAKGMTILMRACPRLAPSTMAASSNDLGMLKKNERSIHMQKGRQNAT